MQGRRKVTGGAVVEVDWGSIVVSSGLGALAFLTATMINRFSSTQKDHGIRITALEKKDAVHLEMHRSCSCRSGGHLDA